MGQKIHDIQPNMRNLEVIGKIIEKRESRSVETRYGPSKVAIAILEDDTGRIRLNLWREQIDAVKEGDTIMIINAFTRMFGESIELNLGKDGKIFLLKWGE